ncbi:hypothetical protein QFZ28_005845 [Neobacillus niacini]|uniref:YolD-like family protein n=1 Tax=Neobacillus niacini TaxID=86668 RepID=UPI00277E7F57|nr:YolD-like family protein [Neobacillus niacini]MDQ1005267.1 hypothetical protein [Neobacillus niacini]
MPETIKMLKALGEDDNKSSKPHLDETKIKEMERLISESTATNMLLEITTRTSGFFTSCVGFETKIDIQDERKSTINLDFYSLTNVIVK